MADQRVLIVGAGIAGLTVANALAHAGVENFVFEARDRIGGRLHTVDLDGVHVDLGASWIHTPIGNPMRALADSVGVGYRSGNPDGDMSAYDCVEKRLLSSAELNALFDLSFERFPQVIGSTQTGASSRATAADAIEAFLADARLTGNEARRASQLLHASVEANAADRAENQSLKWLWHEEEYGGDELGDLPDGGYGAVVAAMASGLDIRLRTEVIEVLTTLRSSAAGESCDSDRAVGVRALREGHRPIRGAFLAGGRARPPDDLPDQPEGTRAVGDGPIGLRHRPGPDVPRVQRWSQPRARPHAGRGGPVGSRDARSRCWQAVPAANCGRDLLVGERSVLTG